MRSLFTVHAGEYLVGSHIEEKLKHLNVWVPSKDTGVDLLVTDSGNRKTVSLQVKFSKDFKETHIQDSLQKGLNSCGWWTLNRDKIKQSHADFWVFVLYSLNKKNTQYVIIEPEELLRRLTKLHDNTKTIQTKTIQNYLWVTNKKDKFDKEQCWETRGLKKAAQEKIVGHTYDNEDRYLRDFTEYLNNWELIKRNFK